MSSSTGPGVIQVRVGELRQLFNAIDPSPFQERDLDPDFEEFIVGWAQEYAPERPLRIEIRFDREFPGRSERDQISSAVRGHFEREAQLRKLRLRRTIREGRLSLLIGVLVLAVCIGGASFLPSLQLGPVGETISESLSIAGWVAMWHPMEILLYGLWPRFRELKLLRRLGNADVVAYSSRRTANAPAAG
jgi:hypothetical protein